MLSIKAVFPSVMPMSLALSLAPRYRLDDSQPWLIGIDPIHRYWIQVNGVKDLQTVISGLSIDDKAAFTDTILRFRRMKDGEIIALPTATSEALVIRRIGPNLFAVGTAIEGAAVEHLFDREALESLLMTAHPDWRCAPEHVQLAKKLLTGSWRQPIASAAA